MAVTKEARDTFAWVVDTAGKPLLGLTPTLSDLVQQANSHKQQVASLWE